MPGRSAKRKGTRVEREFVNIAKAEGLDAHRVPGSGAFEGLPNDVVIEGHRCECKARKNGWATMERWIAGSDALLLKPDRSPSMVVMWWDDWIQMLKELKDYRDGLFHATLTCMDNESDTNDKPKEGTNEMEE